MGFEGWKGAGIILAEPTTALEGGSHYAVSLFERYISETFAEIRE